MQQLRSRRGLRIARAQPPPHRAGIAVQQAARVAGRKPAALFGNTNGRYIELFAIDRPQNRCCRQQRHLMLAAAPAKKNANPQFLCHIQVKLPFKRPHSV
jgi:hypothetical protein